MAEERRYTSQEAISYAVSYSRLTETVVAAEKILGAETVRPMAYEAAMAGLGQVLDRFNKEIPEELRNDARIANEIGKANSILKRLEGKVNVSR
jgi:hypothetical protein